MIGKEVAEFPYRPTACRNQYRIVVLRKDLSVEKGEWALFDDVRHFFYIVFKAVEDIVRESNGFIHFIRPSLPKLTLVRGPHENLEWDRRAPVLNSAQAKPRSVLEVRWQPLPPRIRRTPKRLGGFGNHLLELPELRNSRQVESVIPEPLAPEAKRRDFLPLAVHNG